MKIIRGFRMAVMMGVMLGCLVVTPARAEEYVVPSLENVFKSLVRFGAVDLSDDYILDAYAQVMICDIYNKYYKDEFKWRTVRPIIREQVGKDLATYPTGFRYKTSLRLGRYDFEKKFYPFDEASQRQNINVFPISRDLAEICPRPISSVMPSNYKLVLDKMTNVTGLPLEPEEAKQLAERMERAGNKDRLVYARFNIRVLFIAPIDFAATKKNENGENNKPSLRAQVTQTKNADATVLDSRLDSVEYFEDEACTKPIYTYRP